MARPIGRIAAVTAGLAAAGALVGGACAPLALAALLVAMKARGALGDGALYLSAGLVGAGIGAVGAPTVAWTLLRRVPLGRAIGVTALGAAVGAALGAVAHGGTRGVSGQFVLGGIYGALAGFVVAALALRFTPLGRGPVVAATDNS